MESPQRKTPLRMDPLLETEYKEALSLLKHYDERQLALLKSASVLSSAVASLLLGILELTGNNDPNWPLIAFVSGVTLLGLLALNMAMLQNRLYFTFAGRQANAIRGIMINFTGFYNNRLWTDPDRSAFNPKSAHFFMSIFVIGQVSAFVGLFLYALGVKILWSTVGAIIGMVVLSIGSSRYLYLMSRPVRNVTIICGLQGTGKTTVAKILAGQQGAVLLRTDKIRKEEPKDLEYTPENMQRVYEIMFDRARHAARDKNVVLDATFSKQENRIRAGEIARESSATFHIIEVTSEEEKIKERLNTRTGDSSDADWGVYKKAKDEFEPIEEPHVTVDNSGSIVDLLVQLSSFGIIGWRKPQRDT